MEKPDKHFLDQMTKGKVTPDLMWWEYFTYVIFFPKTYNHSFYYKKNRPTQIEGYLPGIPDW